MRNGTKHDARPAAIYCRISEDRYGDEAGVGRQREDCFRLAERLGLQVAEVFTDNDISASSGKRRPAFEEMMRRAEAGEFAAVIAYTTSRLRRRMLDNERIIALVENRHAKLHTVMSGNVDLSTADGRGVGRTLAAWDQAESERMSERIARTFRQLAEQGKWSSGAQAPMGYHVIRRRNEKGRSEPKLVIDPERAALLREGAGRVLNGESLYGICRDWNERGFTTSRDSVWRPKTLRTALLNPHATGLAVAHHPDKTVMLHEAEWEPVLDRLTWERVRDLLNDPARSNHQPDQAAYGSKLVLGGGLSRCGGAHPDGTPCGEKLMTQPHKGRYRLVCLKQATGGCGRVTVNHDHLLEWLLPMVWEVLDTPEMRRALTADGSAGAEDAELREEHAGIERRLGDLLDLYLERGVTKEEYYRKKTELEDRAVRIEARLADAISGMVLSGVGTIQAAREKWEHADTHWRRAFLSALIRCVTVRPYPKGVAGSLARRKTETDEQYEQRTKKHRAAALRQRVEINWRH